jgi:hypothetical protein
MKITTHGQMYEAVERYREARTEYLAVLLQIQRHKEAYDALKQKCAAARKTLDDARTDVLSAAADGTEEIYDIQTDGMLL